MKRNSSIIAKVNHFFKHSFFFFILIIIFLLLFFIVKCTIKSNTISNEKQKLMSAIINLNRIKADNNDLQIQFNKLNSDKTILSKEIKELSTILPTLRLENEDSIKKSITYERTISNINRLLSQKKEETEELVCNTQLIDSMKNEINMIAIKVSELKSLLNQNQLSIDSKILQDKDQLDLIKEWVHMGNNIKFELLYRKSDHGYSPLVFHKRCDGKSHTLIIVKSKKRIVFGGYTQVPWNGFDYNDGFNFDNSAFLFNLSLQKKYNVKSPNFATYSGPEYLAVFGYYDLVFGCQGITSKFPTSYGENAETLELTGEENVEYVEIELFSILK